MAGGAGFIGSHLVDRLAETKPSKIVVVDNLFLGKIENLESVKTRFNNLKIYIRDLTVMPTLEEIITTEQIERVFDLATIPLPASYVHPAYTYENNIKIVLNFCELLRKDKFRLYVHASSSEAVGSAKTVPMPENHEMNPTTTYGASKAAQDLLIQSFDRMYGIDYLIFRPFNNFGERQNEKTYAGVIPKTITRLLKGEPPILYGNGEQTRDFIYVRDTVDAVVKLVDSPRGAKQVINVANGKEVKIKDLLSLICSAVGYSGQWIHEPPRPSDVERHCADISKLKSIIDFRPTTLEKALLSVVEWYRKGLGL